ncbi:transcription antitermination factor NusB [Candidatus Parcubacteria bacterium]|nr:MAG: transcription antitermination factor NusB [Candidatus Parcubacteria bacterium]GIW69203.1 MAG: hypothetical protein KatS3mg100_697 [Candidatus Parcubacteria bacterium]
MVSARHLARACLLQTLFAADESHKLASRSLRELEASLAEQLTATAQRYQTAPDVAFAQRLLRGVMEKRPILDEIISKAAPEWPLERIAPADRNILRIGLYELLFLDHEEVPHKVAINEAVELAKEFGGPSSPRFINGVLGTVYKELGEPGKDEGPPARHKRVRAASGANASQKSNPSLHDEAPRVQQQETKVGAVVCARHEGELYLAMVHDVFGYWTLSKGGVEKGERLEEALVREIKEEIGLPIEVGPYLGDNEYIATLPDGQKIRKKVHYFLALAPFQEIVLAQKGGLDEARWFRLTDVVELTVYPDLIPILTRAIKAIVAGEALQAQKMAPAAEHSA